MTHNTNYYKNTTNTAKDFYNTIFQNYIKHAKKNNEKLVHIPVNFLNLNTYDIIDIANENGFNAKHLKNRIIKVTF